MGEIAEDCYNRALDELENLQADPDYYGYDQSYNPPRYAPAPRQRRVALPDDFDTLE